MTRNPLVLPQFIPDDEIRLVACPLGVGADGSAVRLNVMDPAHFGRPLLPASGAAPTWLATSPLPDSAALRELYPFHSGALVSPRVRELIEAHGPEVEFIPLRIVREGSDETIADWWFANVHHWRDVFDLSRSKLEYTDFSERPAPWEARLAEFGSAAITGIYELAALPAAFEGGLFLVRAPTPQICERVFVGLDLAEAINRGAEPGRQVSFEEFRLAARPQPPTPPGLGPPRRRWRSLPW